MTAADLFHFVYPARHLFYPVTARKIACLTDLLTAVNSAAGFVAVNLFAVQSPVVDHSSVVNPETVAPAAFCHPVAARLSSDRPDLYRSGFFICCCFFKVCFTCSRL